MRNSTEANRSSGKRLGKTGELIASLRAHLLARPERAVSADSPAIATLDDHLRCTLEFGDRTVATDMPSGLGGLGEEPSPGWYLRSAAAACLTTAIAMRAAECGIALTRLEVQATSNSDGRGLMGIGDIDAGPLDMTLAVTATSSNATDEELAAIIAYADSHAPVGDALRRPIAVETVVTTGGQS